MIKEAECSVDITDWVGIVKAASIARVDQGTVIRNAMAGRISLRIKEKRQYFSQKEVENFRGAPRGKAAHAENGTLAFSKKERAKLKETRAELERKYDDVIYRAVVDEQGVSLEITVYRNGKWTQLPRRKLS